MYKGISKQRSSWKTNNINQNSSQPLNFQTQAKYPYKTNQTKLDNALSLLDNSIKDISTVLSTVNIDDKNSTRES